MTRARFAARLSATATAFLLAGAAPALAANHALILWIGDYGNPRADLPGIDLDGANARKIAQMMGVPEGNITEISNAQLTRANVAAAFGGLEARVKDGDKVFVYYSGHGAQLPARGTNARCTEAMAIRDGLYMDGDLQAALTRLGSKASQVVMMNDSCFSGGAATKSLLDRSMPEGSSPKFLAQGAAVATAVTTDYNCGDPTNVNRMTRSLAPMEKDVRGPQVLYVAASTDTQVSMATRKGSWGTLAWGACLQSTAADANGSGSINGEELQRCAQGLLDRVGVKQTIMLQGNPKLPLSFTQGASATPPSLPAPAATVAAAPAPVPAPAPPPAPAPAATPVNAAQALADLSAASDRSFQVRLSTARDSMRIGQDLLDFSISTNREGYLYILQVGSDGKTFNLLFPNKIDADNYVPVGTHRFPRQTWRVRSGGPAGNSHLLAIVSPDKKAIGRDMDASSVFASRPATSAATRTLIVEATGSEGTSSGRYGASDVVSIREVQ